MGQVKDDSHPRQEGCAGADIIEADLAIEAGLSLRKLFPLDKPGSKNKFFAFPGV